MLVHPNHERSTFGIQLLRLDFRVVHLSNFHVPILVARFSIELINCSDDGLGVQLQLPIDVK